MSQSVTPLLERRLEHQIDRATDAAAEMLRALGLPIDDVDMAETPRRLVQAYAELLSPEPFEMTTFPNSEGYDEMVLVRDIPVRSLCEHHMLPFVGVATSATCPQTGSSGCPSWPAPSTTSPAGYRPRNGSPARSPTTCATSSPRTASAL